MPKATHHPALPGRDSEERAWYVAGYIDGRASLSARIRPPLFRLVVASAAPGVPAGIREVIGEGEGRIETISAGVSRHRYVLEGRERVLRALVGVLPRLRVKRAAVEAAVKLAGGAAHLPVEEIDAAARERGRLAYAGGYVDASASLTAKVERRGKPVFRFVVGSADREVLADIRVAVGVEEARIESVPRRDGAHRLVIDGRLRVARALEMLLPHLVVKRDAADAVLRRAEEAGEGLDCVVPGCWRRRITPRSSAMPFCEPHEQELVDTGARWQVLEVARVLAATGPKTIKEALDLAELVLAGPPDR